MNNELEDRLLLVLVKMERSFFRLILFLPEFLWYFADTLRWLFNPRSRMQKTIIRSLDEVEWGSVHYVRRTPLNISGFSVYIPHVSIVWPGNEIDDDSPDLNEIDLSDHSLKGLDNWEWISIATARAKGYPFDPELISVSKSFPRDDSISLEEYMERYSDPEWILENVPDEYHQVLANMGKDGISARSDSVTSRKYLTELIQRGALYRVTDQRMLKTLEGFGLHDNPDRCLEKREDIQ